MNSWIHDFRVFAFKYFELKFSYTIWLTLGMHDSMYIPEEILISAH